MDFLFNEHQLMFQKSARSFLQKYCTPDLVRKLQENDHPGHDVGLWNKIADMGWIGLIFPEAYGGSGAQFMDLAIIYEEAGKVLLPTSFYSTIGGGLTVLNGGNEEQKHVVLPDVCLGKKMLSLAVYEPNSTLYRRTMATSAEKRDGGYVLNGTKMFVQNAHIADGLIVFARTGPDSENIGAFLVEKNKLGVTCEPMLTFGKDKQSRIELQQVFVPETLVLGKINQGKTIMRKTLTELTALQCAEMVGGTQAVLDKTIAYVKERKQFGQMIGSFQAVQHHLARLAMDVDAARYTTYQAVWSLDQGLSAVREVAIAKSITGEAYKKVTLMAHQLHGGIGYAKEFDLYLWSQRAKATELSLGTRDDQLNIIAEEIEL